MAKNQRRHYFQPTALCFRFMTLLLVAVSFRAHVYGNDQAWVAWNGAGTRRYGFINSSTTHNDSVSLCKSHGFVNLITVRSNSEEFDLVQTIERYLLETQGFLNMLGPITEYWLGTTRVTSNISNSSTTQWIHYDGVIANYTNFQRNFPRNNPNFTCALFRRECVEGCFHTWVNRDCDRASAIEMVLCESRENRSLLDTVEELVNSSLSADSAVTEIWTEAIYNSTVGVNLTTEEVSQGIRVLYTIANRDSNIEVTRNTTENVILSAQAYHDVIRDAAANFTVIEKGNIVRTLELFIDRLNLTASNNVANFSSATFFAEVRFVSNDTSANLAFSSTGNEAVSIIVPSVALQRLRSTVGAGNKSRISFILYRDSVLLPSQYSISQVVSAQINGQAISGLTSPVVYAIPPSPSQDDKEVPFIQCTAWNFSTSVWSDQGCYVIEKSNPPICGCDHLTNFALLVEVYRRPSYTIFDIINTGVGSISCIGFFLTALIYVCFKELRTTKPGPAHINLCLSYGIGYLVFLVGSDKTDNEIPCLVVAALTHYFFLAGWGWTLVEAYTMYQLFVKKSQFLGRHYFQLAGLISYFLPLVVVAINAGLTIGFFDLMPVNGFVKLNGGDLFNSTYVSGYACWLTGKSLYFGFLVEGGIILAINCVIYVLVLRSITWGRKKIQSTRTEASYIEKVYRVITISTMLGLVWVVAIPMEILANNQLLVEPVTYVFSILIAIQGIVTFYLFCVRNVRARRLWWDPVWKKLRRCFRSCRSDYNPCVTKMNYTLDIEPQGTPDVSRSTQSTFTTKNQSIELAEIKAEVSVDTGTRSYIGEDEATRDTETT